MYCFPEDFFGTLSAMNLSVAYFKVPAELKPVLAFIDYSEVASDNFFLLQEDFKSLTELSLSPEEWSFLLGDVFVNSSKEMQERAFSPGLIRRIQDEKLLQTLIEKYDLFSKEDSIPLIDVLNSLEDFIASVHTSSEILVVASWENADGLF